MPSRRLRRVLLVAISLPLAVLTAPAGSAQEPPPPGIDEATPIGPPTSTEEGDRAPSSRLAQTDEALVNRTDATPVAVVIKLDYDSAATYEGGVAGLAATSPAVTGNDLSTSDPAVQAHDAFAAEQEAAAIAAIEAVVPQARFGQSLRLVYGGITATVPANRIKDVLRVDGVVAVQEDTLLEPLTDSSGEFIGAPTIYDQVGGAANAGAGVIYGNLDTGLWPEHPSFADQGNLAAPPPRADGTARTCEYGDNPLTAEADVFACNDKLIGGEAFLDTYHAVVGDELYPGTARDDDGHGTHTASTSAGNVVEDVEVFGVQRGPIAGIAPGAWVIEYRVCGPLGCFSSDSTAAVEEAILDGVDVINFSISGGTSPFTDPVELAFLDAYAAGVFVAASAGNDGPGASTANHLSPWVTSVGASTQTREFSSTLTLTADDASTAAFTGASITAGIDSPLPVVLASAAPYGDALCQAPAPPGTFTGVIVACQRGVIGRVDKGFNVLQGGAAGMVLYNPTLADIETDNHWLPTVHLADGTDFLAYMASHTGVTATFTAGTAGAGQGDVMAAFSSRGPAGQYVKPDITAPGVQILAGHTPTPGSTTGGPPGEYFQAIAGTSMSGPHIAGSAILLAGLHPTWTPGQIRSALMTTATTEVVKEDLVTPADPFDMGAGRVDLSVAGTAPVTFDETAARFFALGNDPAGAVHLNIPSINAPVMPGRLVTTRVATNVTNRRQTFTTSATTTGGSISVSPRRFVLRPGQSQVLTVTIASTQTGVQQFGEVRIQGGGAAMHLPVAFVPAQGEVELVQSCAPLSIREGDTTTCDVTAQNNSFSAATVDLRTATDGRLRILSATGATVSNGVASLPDVVLAGAQPGIPSVAPGIGPAGYLPLDLFGIAPTAVGDEEILNFDVPGFVYAGAIYTSIGITSNGYAVAGGGGSEDVQFEPPGAPDPARPNNVLAPLWTDLTGDGAPGIYIATLADAVNTWLVVEWRLNLWGTTSLQSFQLWIGVNGTEDISYAYDPADLPDDPGMALAVGAENLDGSAGQYYTTPPTEDLRVTSSDPAPGDSVSYSLVARGRFPGTGVVTSTMDADIQAGTTVVSTDVSITRRRGHHGHSFRG
jgi:subtilisin family serine protease